MSPNFSWCNFMINALHLASGAPGDTNILAQFLSHITGQNFVRINVTDDNVQTNEGSADSPEHQSNQSISRNSHPIPSVGISSPPKIELPSSVDEMKSDDESYQTCSSGHNVVHSALFDSADSARFPQGDISPYVVNDPKFRLSWTMMTYGFNCVNANGERRLQQFCLGIYKCPSAGCKFVQNAVAPRKNRVKYAKPTKAFGSDKCLIHGLVLVHISCKATCTIICSHSSVTIKHAGQHKHDRPHEKVSKEAVARLEDMVHNNSEAKPIQILLGSPTRKPARSIHPALNNLDRLSYYMRQSKSKVPTLKLQDLGSWQESMGCNFLKKADLKSGIFIIQFPGMNDIAKANLLYAYQTDTIEGWMYELNNHSWNVTVTSTHSVDLGRHVPVLMSVTKQRTANDYKHHFYELFNCLDYASFEQCEKLFPGNISDFSLAEQGGFSLALEEYYNERSEDGNPISSMSIEGFYKFCHVSTIVNETNTYWACSHNAFRLYPRYISLEQFFGLRTITSMFQLMIRSDFSH